ncbi:MAG: galactokinase [Oscillospiraceae bacterium]|nr:galactokinase [Oscillospiraceae bacterium]
MKPIVRDLNIIYPAEQLERQIQRYRAAEVGFAEHFGTLGEHRFFRAPGQTEICGNHTYHNNGKALAASVDLDTIAIAEPIDEDFIEIKSEGFPADRIELSDLEIHEDEKNSAATLIRGVVRGFKKSGHKIGGFRAYTTSTIIENGGLSRAAAFEVLVGTILSHLYNGGQISPVKIAQIAQFAENTYFGRKCGMMSQLACSVGGFVSVDFKDDDTPIIEGIPFDFASCGHALCIVDPKAEQKDMQSEIEQIDKEMRMVAEFFDCTTLRSLSLADITLNIGGLRFKLGDRAVLRALHFFNENERVERAVHALKHKNFDDFLTAARESGESSFKYLQNVYNSSDVRNQSVSVALILADNTLHRKGACKIHGAGFQGTVQAFVPMDMLKQFKMNTERTFGVGACHVLTIRPTGACEVLMEKKER